MKASIVKTKQLLSYFADHSIGSELADNGNIVLYLKDLLKYFNCSFDQLGMNFELSFGRELNMKYPNYYFELDVKTRCMFGIYVTLNIIEKV